MPLAGMFAVKNFSQQRTSDEFIGRLVGDSSSFHVSSDPVQVAMRVQIGQHQRYGYVERTFMKRDALEKLSDGLWGRFLPSLQHKHVRGGNGPRCRCGSPPTRLLLRL